MVEKGEEMTDKKDKVREIKKAKKKVMIVNSSFEIFSPGSQINASLMKLKMQMADEDALALRRFIKTVTESPEFKAYEELRTEIVEEFMTKQEKLPEEKRRPPRALNIPKWMDLMNMESKLEIEKFEVNLSRFPKWNDPERIFNAYDMEFLDGLFEFAK